MKKLVVLACLVITASGCAVSSSSTTTTVFDIFGLECRTDRLESVVNDYGAATGDPSVEEVFAEFFDGKGLVLETDRGAHFVGVF